MACTSCLKRSLRVFLNDVFPLSSGTKSSLPRRFHATSSTQARHLSTNNPLRTRASPLISERTRPHSQPSSSEPSSAILEPSPASIEALSAELLCSPEPRKPSRPTRPTRSLVPHSTPRTSSSSSKPDKPSPYISAFSRSPREPWQAQKAAVLKKLEAAPWSPRKRLSPDCLAGIRALHAEYPTKFTTPVLADQFKVSPEVIRRILKSKWVPSDEEKADRNRRWEKRGEKIWERLVEVGVRAPKKWRKMGVGQKIQRDGARSGRSRVEGKGAAGAVPWERADEVGEHGEWVHQGLGGRIL